MAYDYKRETRVDTLVLVAGVVILGVLIASASFLGGPEGLEAELETYSVQYEYRILTKSRIDERELNLYGAQGWRVVSVYYDGWRSSCVFIREKVNEVYE